MEKSPVAHRPIDVDFARVAYALSGLHRDESEAILELVEFLSEQLREQAEERQWQAALKLANRRRLKKIPLAG